MIDYRCNLARVADVRERIAIKNDQISDLAGSDHSQAILAKHLCPIDRCCVENLHRRDADSDKHLHFPMHGRSGREKGARRITADNKRHSRSVKFQRQGLALPPKLLTLCPVCGLQVLALAGPFPTGSNFSRHIGQFRNLAQSIVVYQSPTGADSQQRRANRSAVFFDRLDSASYFSAFKIDLCSSRERELNAGRHTVLQNRTGVLDGIYRKREWSIPGRVTGSRDAGTLRFGDETPGKNRVKLPVNLERHGARFFRVSNYLRDLLVRANKPTPRPRVSDSVAFKKPASGENRWARSGAQLLPSGPDLPPNPEAS